VWAEPQLELPTLRHRLEHRYGQYSRAISLPATAEGAGVEAVYQAGVLTVTVPKRAEAKPAKISVRTA
jgi:HSP20 family protein